jgi:hypothetical protein
MKVWGKGKEVRAITGQGFVEFNKTFLNLQELRKERGGGVRQMTFCGGHGRGQEEMEAAAPRRGT